MADGWTKSKVAAFRSGFFDFLKHLIIDSKETGVGPLVLYGAQKRFLDEVFEGLENDIHFFVVLKARQLGISTIVRALILFWAFMHKGLHIALVYDTDSNKEDARLEMRRFTSGLPRSHKVVVTKDDRYSMEFANGSRISWLVAGIKKSKSSGGLGRSRGINCAGCTEVSSWADIEGVRAFERSLAQKYPNRLYIWESTARGFNIFHDLWMEAKADDLTKKAIFIGWWAKEDYAFEEGTALYEKYSYPATDEELEKIRIVQDRYGHAVTMEQLAWFRHAYDPDRDDDSEREGQEIIQQELPWFEEESWLLSGSQFFSAQRVSEVAREVARLPVKGYRYLMSDEFTATVVEPARLVRQAQLKVWEEPDPGATYVIGADPAYGSSEKGDRYVAQVLKCYADGVDQVAEFCTTLIPTYQFAWVIAHLCGAYANARLLLELNGPGNAVWNEFRNLETLLKTGYLRQTAEEKGLVNMFDNVRQYLWARQDSLSRNPSAFHWETTPKRKVMVMERLRDFFQLGALRVRSFESLEEMRSIVRDGDSIEGDGSNKDDRVMALALAVRAWEDAERKRLIGFGRTREVEAKRRTFTQEDIHQLFQQGLVGNFFNAQQRARVQTQRAMRRKAWR